jgi:uncharacterized peroxidase-related enzyme
MANFRKIEEAEAENKINNLYVDLKNRFGITFVPDFFKFIAPHEDVATGIWAGYEHILLGGCLPQQVKELIFVTVALRRGCVYCSSTHLAVCDMLEVPTDVLESIKTEIDNVTPDRFKDILLFAVKMIEAAETFSEDDFKSLNKHGISEAEITEIIGMTFLANTAVNVALSMGMKVIEPEIKEYLKTENLRTGLETD